MADSEGPPRPHGARSAGPAARKGGRDLHKVGSAEAGLGKKPGRKAAGRRALPGAGAESVVPQAVQEADCYHGMIHKDELGTLLLREGDFVIRLGRSAQAADRITLSVLWDGAPRHFILESSGAGARRRVWIEMERQFGSEMKLVEWHVETGTPLGPKACVLRNPVTHQSWELDVENITTEKELGAGAFGKVFRGSLDIGGQGERTPAAIKQCEAKRLKLEDQNKFMKEAEIGRRLNHPNVIRCYGVQHMREPLMIVMELAAGGSLRSRLRTPAGSPDAPTSQQLLVWSREACAALEYLEQKKILHRDIAARNCLLGPAPALTLKLADFGLAKADTTAYKMQTKVKLAPRWMAPEVMTAGEFSTASEVWSLGVLLWEIHSKGEEPFKGYAAVEIKERVAGPEKLRLACPPASFPGELARLVQSCWASHPSARPTFARLGLSLDQLLGRLPGRLQNAPDNFVF